MRYVISLAHRIVDVYAGGDAIPEGELWIKRNCIRLRRTQNAADSEAESRPFYLFSENCSDKEDFYFALLRNQERQTGMPISPPLFFEQPHIVKLVQQLHASEENLQTRWINALAGRLFLGVYKTPNVEEFIRMKVTKKIARVAKPAFIQSINLQRIVMGDSAPMLTNPKLRELTLDGDLTAEADIKYNGNFRLEIAAVARIDLGSRFKTRYVNMVLAGILKKLEGHILIRVKPPPSNRFWVTFEHPPKMDLTIEPIVSSRQITYGMILRAIENRIREVVAETLVLPNWDDMPFFDTFGQPLRGGIWEDATKAPMAPDAAHDTPLEDALVDDGSTLNEEPGESQFLRKDEKVLSMPNLGDSELPSLKSRKTAKSAVSVGTASDSASTSGAEVRGSPVKPRSMRSGSFASIARPVVAPDTAVVEAQKSPLQHQHNAITAMKDISSRSHPTSPVESPVGSPAVPSVPLAEANHDGTREPGPSVSKTDDESGSITDLFGEFVHSQPNSIIRPEPAAFSANSEQSSLYSHATDSSTAHSDISSARSSLASRKTSLSEKRQILNLSLNSATSAAKKWFASRQEQREQRQHPNMPHSSASAANTSSPSFATSSHHASTTGTPTRSQSPSHDDQEPQREHHHLDRPPTSSSISSATKPKTPSGSPPKQYEPSSTPRSSSITSTTTVPMGRGQPLPPPGQPLPPPVKPESKWVQGSAQLLGLAKRKSVPVSPGGAPSGRPGSGGAESGHGRTRSSTTTTSVGNGDESEGQEPPALPPRKPSRKAVPPPSDGRRASMRRQHQEVGGEPQLLVIAAPESAGSAGGSDASAPVTPERSGFGDDGASRIKGDGEEDERREGGGEEDDEEGDEMEGSMFNLEMDDEGTGRRGTRGSGGRSSSSGSSGDDGGRTGTGMGTPRPLSSSTAAAAAENAGTATPTPASSTTTTTTNETNEDATTTANANPPPPPPATTTSSSKPPPPALPPRAKGWNGSASPSSSATNTATSTTQPPPETPERGKEREKRESVTPTFSSILSSISQTQTGKE